jgi:AraC family transcriptional regulator, regulatory protein of adaptative response / methylated-DNA-[protein]-cysteine methyltransferase
MSRRLRRLPELSFDGRSVDDPCDTYAVTTRGGPTAVPTGALQLGQSREPEASEGPGAYALAMHSILRFEAAGRPPSDVEWDAIASRRSIGRPFVFVVTSTGIICAPGCPARTPGRERVRVLARLEDGTDAGARPCLRCRPHQVSHDEDRRFRAGSGCPPTAQADASEQVRMAIARLTAAMDGGDEIPSDRELAAAAAVPERRLRETFRHNLGVTPRGWVAARRAELLRARLARGQAVTSAVFDSGFGSSSAAYEAVGGGLGMTPGSYRAGASGEVIRWSVAPIPEGLAVVAATERGLCSVLMGSTEDALAAELRSEFPLATLTRDDAAMATTAALVQDLAQGHPRPDAVGLPLDVHATAFRRRVWEALRRIPVGETRSYGEIAGEVGAPGAARAVGTACAQNPVPIVVPCHRVVASNGGLGGYSGGLARKRQLLGAEGVLLPSDRGAPAGRSGHES